MIDIHIYTPTDTREFYPPRPFIKEAMVAQSRTPTTVDGAWSLLDALWYPPDIVIEVDGAPARTVTATNADRVDVAGVAADAIHVVWRADGYGHISTPAETVDLGPVDDVYITLESSDAVVIANELAATAVFYSRGHKIYRRRSTDAYATEIEVFDMGYQGALAQVALDLNARVVLVVRDLVGTDWVNPVLTGETWDTTITPNHESWDPLSMPDDTWVELTDPGCNPP